MKFWESRYFNWLLLVIITFPAWLILLNPYYPSMHDDQHIVRLFLLDQGIRQGYVYPRWVNWLGFGFGYPLFNFYPPLIYYVAEGFHLFGFSLIWSIKLMIITGFILAAWGIYLFVKNSLGRWPALLAGTLYTYFFYHAITVYIRGALAEFFSFASFAWLMVALQRVYHRHNKTSVIILAISWSLIILTHPLIAFPSGFFIGGYVLFCLIKTKKKMIYLKTVAFGLLLGLGLSAFFWLPSMSERQYTLTDQILTNDLANYKLHYVYPDQLWYSPWGFGGSTPGRNDGMSFQLGKIPIMLAALSLIGALFVFTKKRKENDLIKSYGFFCLLLFFSLFMTTNYSGFIWNRLQYLWYIQFPWRFLTFTAFFISVIAAYGFNLAGHINFIKRRQFLLKIGTAVIIIITVIKYSPYFRPQQLLRVTDKERATYEEIAWRVSNTSFEFIPKGVPLKKSALGTSIFAIDKNDLPKKSFIIISGSGSVKEIRNEFEQKIYQIAAQTPLTLRINTFAFPGWKATLDRKEINIENNNLYRLITVKIPSGDHRLAVIYFGTRIHSVAALISIISALFTGFFLLKLLIIRR